MLFSSSRFSRHEEAAYHRNGGEAQDILEIDRLEPIRHDRSSRDEGGAGICAAAGSKQS